LLRTTRPTSWTQQHLLESSKTMAHHRKPKPQRLTPSLIHPHTIPKIYMTPSCRSFYLSSPLSAPPSKWLRHNCVISNPSRHQQNPFLYAKAHYPSRNESKTLYLSLSLSLVKNEMGRGMSFEWFIIDFSQPKQNWDDDSQQHGLIQTRPIDPKPKSHIHSLSFSGLVWWRTKWEGGWVSKKGKMGGNLC
jgi:hypothetical protein